MSEIKPLSNLENAVIVPALQAGITGTLAAMTGGAFAWIFGANPAPWALACGASVTLLSWLSLRQQWQNRIDHLLNMPAAETVANNQTVKLVISNEDFTKADYVTMPIDRARLAQLAAGLASGRPFVVREWTGNHGLLSGAEFSQLRTVMIDRGLARWKSSHDNKAGAELTPGGRAAMRYIAGLPSPAKMELVKRAENF